ncbi:MAG TPA: hypothetical protein VGN01_17600 [Acidobacteriaceae bacterium]|jgi:hypothetical protein
MLWYKGWLETRLKLAVVLGVVSCFIIFLHSLPSGSGRVSVVALTGVPRISVVWICAFLAGAGIATQPGLQATKGLHGSMLFTLALPVSRFRLLAIRAAIGWLESTVAISIFCYGIWLRFPAFREAVTGVDMIEFSGILIASASALYFASVLLATFLDDQWRIWATMLVPFIFWQLTSRIPLPAFADILRATGNGSPLITHTMPWSTVAFSLALVAALFLAAYKIAESREY